MDKKMMKKKTIEKKSGGTLGYIIWVVIIAALIAMLIIPATRAAYISANDSHPYIVGFFNFAILATMGDLLANRITSGKWTINITTFFKLLIWGFIGAAITLFFGLGYAGVGAMQSAHMLPFAGTGFGSQFAHALFTAILLNVSFGPAMFVFHKFTDSYINARYNKKPSDLNSLIATIDWKTFFKFTVFTTLPCFWMPCHTIVFLLPKDYRVLLAAFLSIALGLLLSIKNKVASK